jgi:hypothetical protein
MTLSLIGSVFRKKSPHACSRLALDTSPVILAAGGTDSARPDGQDEGSQCTHNRPALGRIARRRACSEAYVVKSNPTRFLISTFKYYRSTSYASFVAEDVRSGVNSS